MLHNIPDEQGVGARLCAVCRFVDKIDADDYDDWLANDENFHLTLHTLAATYDGAYLFVLSPINLLPKKNVEEVLEYMLDADFTPYKLGVEGRQIYMCYRIHLADITPESEERILAEIVEFAHKADEMDNMMVEKFGCEFSAYTKQND